MEDSRKSTARRPYPDDWNLRNLDVIPGLAFYAYATRILENLQGANSLHYVQATLLVGLYAGQLAHPFQSHGWVNQAAGACQVLVRLYGLPATRLLRRGLTYNSKRYGKMRDGPVKDLYNFAYWTCLQLESGISRSEALIALPKGHFTLSLSNEISAPSMMTMFFYMGRFDVVISRWLLNSASNDGEMLEMWRNIFHNLKPGGRVIGISPDLGAIEKGGSLPVANYNGQSVKVMEMLENGGVRVQTTLHTSDPFPFKSCFLLREVYNRGAKLAGMNDVQWVTHPGFEVPGLVVDMEEVRKQPLLNNFTTVWPLE